MIRVAVLDDHPAVLAGLQRLVERAPDLLPAAFADSQRKLLRALDGHDTDVAVLDYDLGHGDGLTVCQRLKERARPPGVILYSAYAGHGLTIPAQLAGADAVIAKSDPVAELLEAIRRVARGEHVLPPIDVELQRAVIARLHDEDVAVAAMLLAGTTHEGIADALGLERREVARRVARILARARPDRPTASGAAEDGRASTIAPGK